MIQKGKKHISNRTTAPINAGEIFGDLLKLDDELKAELATKGLEGRFVDAQKLYAFGGYHKNGWQAYKREKGANIGNTDFKLGTDPDGIVRRGTLILAVKPIELAVKHRSYLRAKSDRYSKVQQSRAEELRRSARASNTEVEVLEGYEENEIN